LPESAANGHIWPILAELNKGPESTQNGHSRSEPRTSA
jgi:hypothetical protein